MRASTVIIRETKPIRHLQCSSTSIISLGRIDTVELSRFARRRLSCKNSSLDMYVSAVILPGRQYHTYE